MTLMSCAGGEGESDVIRLIALGGCVPAVLCMSAIFGGLVYVWDRRVLIGVIRRALDLSAAKQVSTYIELLTNLCCDDAMRRRGGVPRVS